MRCSADYPLGSISGPASIGRCLCDSGEVVLRDATIVSEDLNIGVLLRFVRRVGLKKTVGRQCVSRLARREGRVMRKRGSRVDRFGMLRKRGYKQRSAVMQKRTFGNHFFGLLQGADVEVCCETYGTRGR